MSSFYIFNRFQYPSLCHVKRPQGYPDVKYKKGLWHQRLDDGSQLVILQKEAVVSEL